MLGTCSCVYAVHISTTAMMAFGLLHRRTCALAALLPRFLFVSASTQPHLDRRRHPDRRRRCPPAWGCSLCDSCPCHHPAHKSTHTHTHTHTNSCEWHTLMLGTVEKCFRCVRPGQAGTVPLRAEQGHLEEVTRLGHVHCRHCHRRRRNHLPCHPV